MKRISHPLLFLTLVLFACSPIVSSPLAVSPPTTEVPPSPKSISEQASLVPTFEGCAYQWAYKDLPDLSNEFQESVQKLQTGSRANAYIFGEDCIHTNGKIDFLAMETDFNVTLQVNDISNETELGDWIIKVMQIIVNIPKEEIVGPRPGRVSINFQSDSEQNYVNFYVDQYQALPSGMTSVEIYEA